ncbi:hypothetical protein [Paenibacillus prosopidis]|uniref:hypothetical protein n=1 Tax=Paenibacillus prosopidis TaxID=630520 RepID=UPI000DF45540|nr:hypothetical protein [Paenibacillus prosopidis]
MPLNKKRKDNDPFFHAALYLKFLFTAPSSPSGTNFFSTTELKTELAAMTAKMTAEISTNTMTAAEMTSCMKAGSKSAKVTADFKPMAVMT